MPRRRGHLATWPQGTRTESRQAGTAQRGLLEANVPGVAQALENALGVCHFANGRPPWQTAKPLSGKGFTGQFATLPHWHVGPGPTPMQVNG
jgi:hypothetical protein